ncbi:phage Gp37/Gp68 family protein [Labrys sp. KB_33_2]|uniref:phage Gp37/Gp68 family protein n=1 Tax=Labrys sp. KB_33_2 TaxID=3237479 RepID=UPI003F923E16
MGENTKIEWAHHTFNPWVGCTKVSPACDHCYAEGWAKRTGQGDLWQGNRRRTAESNWRHPLKWNRQAEAEQVRYRVFCASLADVFDNQVPDIWRSDLFDVIEDTPHLDWLLLTKRPQNIRKMIWPKWDAGMPRNIWLGMTAENQQEFDRRIRFLTSAPASIRFLSCEPLLGPLKLGRSAEYLDWVITGGESGHHARPTRTDWFRSLRDECQRAGIGYLHKQNGEWIGGDQVPEDQAIPSGTSNDFGLGLDDNERVWRVGKKFAGRLLDGVEHNGFPEVPA